VFFYNARLQYQSIKMVTDIQTNWFHSQKNLYFTHRRIQKRKLGGGQMASAVARAYNGGMGALPPVESRGEAPLKLTIFYYWQS
jgi:hypothetical protein